MRNESSVFGELCIRDQEGGYCEPSVSVITERGEVTIMELIVMAIPGTISDDGPTGHRVEIIVRHVMESQPAEV